jgi:hypothetical protein
MRAPLRSRPLDLLYFFFFLVREISCTHLPIWLTEHDKKIFYVFVFIFTDAHPGFRPGRLPNGVSRKVRPNSVARVREKLCANDQRPVHGCGSGLERPC